MQTNLKMTMKGHVLIKDLRSGEVILDKKNAMHPQNMASAVAQSLSRESTGYIYKIAFGNGGTFYNSEPALVFRPPNTIGNADLYNQTYEVQVDEQSVGTPSNNSVISAPSPDPSISSIITITVQLNADEPAGQASDDNETTDPESTYTFDEIGLKTSDDRLLTHLIFSPIEKTANRAFLIIYTIITSLS